MNKFSKIISTLPILFTLGTSSAFLSSCNKIKYPDYSISCIGDSITWGEIPNSSAMQMNEPYPVVVKNNLSLGYANNYGIRYSTVSNGTNGYAPMVDRIKDYIPNSSQIIILWGGINDWGKGCPLGTIDDTDPSTYYGALDKICNIFKDNYADRFCMFMTPLPCKYADATLDNYAQAVIDVCQTKYGYYVLDLYHNSNFSQEWSKAGNDGIHPTQAYVKSTLGPQIADFIAENFWK